MVTFQCDGFHPVEAESATAAARVFAGRLARRRYSNKGYCTTVRLDHSTENGLSHQFEAFIGKYGPGESGGLSVWLYVTERR